MPDGGTVGESKFDIVQKLPADCTIPSALIAPGELEDRVETLRRSVERQGWTVPLVLKPDVGQRGVGVRLCTDVGRRPSMVDRVHDQVIAALNKTLDVSPEFGVAHWALAQCYRPHGDTRREIEELRRAVELSGNSAYMRAHLAYGFATSGDRGRAMAIQRELETESRERIPRRTTWR